MMNSLDTALANCLSAMEAGHSMEDCLNRFSTQASELRTLLTLSNDVRSVPVPRARPEAKAAQQQRMLAALEAGRIASPTEPGLLERLWASLAIGPAFRWAAVMAVVVVLLVGGGWASVTAAAHSLPGDVLHPVKRAHEWVQISLAIDPGAKQQLREEFFWERLEETQGVLDRGRQAEVEFAGALTQVTDDFWQIEGFRVQLSQDTVVLGEPALGRQVRVRAQAQSTGELVALRLQVEPAEESEPGPDSGVGLTPLPSPSPTPSPTLIMSRTAEGVSDPVPTPSSTPVPTSARPADREETEVAPASSPVPEWLQKFRRTPRPQSTRPMIVPSLTPRPRERLRSGQLTAVASPTPQQLRLRTRMPGDTPQARPPLTRTPTLTQPEPTQPQPARTRMPENPPDPKPERTREPEPERPKDPRPEPPRPRPRSTKSP